MAKLFESSKDVGKSGFQAIKKLRGLQVALAVVSPPATWDSEKQLVQCSLEDVSILEMLPGEDPPELKDNKLTVTWSYGLTKDQVDAGKKPPPGCPWMMAAVASCEAIGKAPSSFTSSYVTLERRTTVLYKPYKKDAKGKYIVGEDGKKVHDDPVTTESYFYIVDETEGYFERVSFLQAVKCCDSSNSTTSPYSWK